MSETNSLSDEERAEIEQIVEATEQDLSERGDIESPGPMLTSASVPAWKQERAAKLDR